MEKILDVAAFIFDEYKKYSKEDTIDEMKLHKLLYFAQRESLAITGEPLFSETFEGWKFGPVSTDVRLFYSKDGICTDTNPISDESQYILKNVIIEYGQYASWKLSELSHNEISWINSRKGLREGENGSKEMLLDDIIEDAKKVRPYDYIWDMYYDEFDDEEDEDL